MSNKKKSSKIQLRRKHPWIKQRGMGAHSPCKYDKDSKKMASMFMPAQCLGE